jgi:hypothetical protein
MESAGTETDETVRPDRARSGVSERVIRPAACLSHRTHENILLPVVFECQVQSVDFDSAVLGLALAPDRLHRHRRHSRRRSTGVVRMHPVCR